MENNSFIPVALTIAGSDSSGGAGMQADLKTFTSLGVYGTSAITCTVAEHPGRVASIISLPADHVGEQIRLVAEAFPIAAAKTGMLFTRDIVEAVVAETEREGGALFGVPLVVDPVMVASSGAQLLKDDAVEAIRTRLIPLAALVTPNRDEAALLLGRPITTLDELRAAGRELVTRYRVPFLVKGGHLRGTHAVDLLCIPGADGVEITEFTHVMIPDVDPHGTGCTFSASVAAGLAQGLSLKDSVLRGKKFITAAIVKHYKIGGYTLLNQMPVAAAAADLVELA
ncbi:MAG TPA: bifunctional hydroxymethylpyrimidine kinase/phosphomethylpyrimidine kinase [Candidatus Methylacidiphilales bacterium]|nr:bifunctional hydroxymethylpyrimidine kinase/phosphomethylpyrimidine kinase [Candidatus Methylacidiphilales bacterium]